MKFLLAIFIVLLLISISTADAFAIYDPLSVANNRVGIHITDENDLIDANNLVNSSGGDWGYVTLVVRDDEMIQAKWQNTFDLMRRLHLIPIVRIATHQDGNSWSAPSVDDAEKWANFLNSLNWVIQNRYVVLFNEPNHASEWGGSISPNEYTKVASSFYQALKNKSTDFYILSAGMDMSAPNSKSTMDAFRFWKAMYAADNSIFTKFDGIATHSYPNPGFVGNPDDTGSKSILSFVDEIEFLKDYGLDTNTLVFITETGWIHKEGVNDALNVLGADQIAKNFTTAFNSVWNKPNVIAVTPFILNYTTAPFDHFSFKSPTGEFYPQYDAIQELAKVKGEPKQITSATIVNEVFPDSLISSSEYLLQLKIKNTGQSIWDDGDITAKISGDFAKVSVDKVMYTQPGQEAILNINLSTPDNLRMGHISLEVYYKNQSILPQIAKDIQLIPPTSLNINAFLAFKVNKNFTADLLIYDGDRLIKKLSNVLISRNVAKILDLHDVIPGRVYRFVLTKRFYLPEQVYEYVDKTQTDIKFNPLLPLDFNSDGKLTIQDVPSALLHPLQSIKLFIPL